MPKIYIAPSAGTSEDLPSPLRHFFQEEECDYRATIPKKWLTDPDENCDKDYSELFKNARDVVHETVQIYDGSDQEYVSFDYPGIRYYFDYENLEDDLEAIINLTGLRTILSCRDLSEGYEQEMREMVYGEPVVEGWVCELETEVMGAEKIIREIDKGDEWKAGKYE